MSAAAEVLRLDDTDRAAVAALLGRFGIEFAVLAPGVNIPGSYWGESEAGLQGRRLSARPDTPVHSILHEASHYICMTPARRAPLERDAGGDDDEESAVCYLQILLAAELPGVGRERLIADMDRWGYSFRLGSTAAWLGSDAAHARQWLQRYDIVDTAERIRWRLRG